jgi:hypothetical protein
MIKYLLLHKKLTKLKANEADKGFSLIEALVALGLLISVIGGTLVVAERGLMLASEARDKITAFYLAQEPIEYIRYLRDSNRLSGVGGWTDGFSGCLGDSCGVDPINDKVLPCTDASMPPGCNLLLDPANGQYTHTDTAGNGPSKFNRTVSISEAVSDTEIDIEVTVTWPGRFNPKSFVLRDRIFNW